MLIIPFFNKRFLLVKRTEQEVSTKNLLSLSDKNIKQNFSQIQIQSQEKANEAKKKVRKKIRVVIDHL